MILSTFDESSSSSILRLSNNFQKFVNIFFRSTKLIFGVLANHYKDLVLDEFSAPQSNFGKKQPKKAF